MAFCPEHSGFKARIDNLEEEYKDMNSKQDKIFTRLNIILGGICVACIMLVVNIVINYPG